ncbi:MAG: hypothetical protein FWH02_07255 [Oscillospiraceae bacterium]|nr:hypothetical protein [Oscillospiraceae bacterium]
MPDFKAALAGAQKLLGKDAKVKLLVILGLLGMGLILLSQLLGGQPATGPPVDSPGSPALFTSEEYVARTEERLRGLIIRIEGVGSAEVMVTLANSGELVYAKEEKRSLDKSGDGENITSRENVQTSFILVDAGMGSRQPLVRTQLEPKIQGVVIVCEGADDLRVRQSLINVVTTTLGISSAKVCVEKIAA